MLGQGNVSSLTFPTKAHLPQCENPSQRSVLTVVRFHCLFCHGYEEKNVNSAGVLAVGDMANPSRALHLARMAKRLTPNVTIYTDGADELAQKTAEAAADDDIKVESKMIKRLEKGEESSVILHFKDAQTFTEGFLVSIPAFSVNESRELAVETES